MQKQLMYRYIGVNGTIDTAIEIEDAPCIRLMVLQADKGQKLTKDGISFRNRVTVPEKEVNSWYEVQDVGQE